MTSHILPREFLGLKKFLSSTHLSKRLPTLFLMLTLLAGCQTLPRAPDLTAEQQAHRLPALQHWEAEGKIALRLADDNQSAFFKWSQHRENYAIHLFGPFGRGTTWLRRTSHGVTLENAEVGHLQAETPEALMEELLGWQVPVSSLRHWVLGSVDPNHPVDYLELDAEGFASTLHQQGWHVEFQNLHRIQGWRLPGRIRAHRDQMRITLVVNRWNQQP